LVTLLGSPVNSTDGGLLGLFVSASSCCNGDTSIASTTLFGPLLSATDSALVAGSGSLIDLVISSSTSESGIASATFTSVSSLPLIALTRSPVVSLNDGLFNLSVQASGGVVGIATATLLGPILSATDTAIAG